MGGVLAQFAKRLARAEHARGPIDLRIDVAKQTEHRAANALRKQAAQRFLAAVESVTPVSRKQFVARIARERHGDMLAREFCDLIGRQRGTIAERLIKNAGQKLDRVGFVAGHNLNVLAPAIALRHLRRIRPFVEFRILKSDGEAFDGFAACLRHQRHGCAGIGAAGEESPHRHIGHELRFHGGCQAIQKIMRRIVQRLAVVGGGLGVPILDKARGLAALDRQCMAGGEFLHALIDRARIANITESEEFLDGTRVDLARKIGVLRQRLQFGPEDEGAIRQERIIERLFAQAIAGEKQRAVLRIPQHKGKLAGKMADAITAPLLPGVQDDFGIRRGSEVMPFFLQFLAQFAIVENLTVEGEAEIARLVEHRLGAGDEIDDGKAAVAESDAGGKMKSLAIGAAMADRIVHRLDEPLVWGALAARIEPTANAAHGGFSAGLRAFETRGQIGHRGEGLGQMLACLIFRAGFKGNGNGNQRAAILSRERTLEAFDLHIEPAGGEFSARPIGPPDKATLGG